ncbi:Predicted ATP-binding protein involved in virulence [Flavobacterium fontis]|uniref:Predicted ATP-binding protein involved in virulence n=1 Tax=Flavobacterium fontis TaxID=1124188 RepID=A0A1M5EBK4_9FLAO|nr:AAA family ATPase [Flavobacterium fontis]SHF76577.1 Predicted ATP-binding protein involved in virulence [Flavobacterium fontis]
MKINDIRIINFKGIEDKTFEFNPHFNVLIGDNGAGKTSILDAVSIAMGTILMKSGASFGYSGTRTRPLYKHEIRNVITELGKKEPQEVTLLGSFQYDNQRLNWCRRQPRFSKNLSYKEASMVTSLGEYFSQNIEQPINLPLLVHHTTARLWGNIFDKKTKYERLSSRFEGYYACLDSRSIKDKFIGWFKTYEDNILKFEKDRSLYNAFTKAITSMVKDWSYIHYSWDQEDIMGKTTSGNWTPLRNLSDGYRGIVHLTADLAYRAIQLNPHLGARAVVDTEGIVLIDEIDMHLHPKWQRHVIEDLKRTFPKIQFIVTTHSPFIVQSLKKEEVISLDGENIDEDPFTKSIEEIAEQDMDVVDVKRSQKFLHFQEVATQYFNLIEEGKNSENDEQVRELKEKLDNLELEFNDDPVYVALMQAERKTELP